MSPVATAISKASLAALRAMRNEMTRAPAATTTTGRPVWCEMAWNILDRLAVPPRSAWSSHRDSGWPTITVRIALKGPAAGHAATAATDGATFAGCQSVGYLAS